MRVLYFDCYSGASGDMILGALIDAGAPATEVHAAIDNLGVPGWSLEVTPVKRQGLRATRATVVTTGAEGERAYSDIVALIADSALPQVVADRALGAFDVLARAEGRVHGVAPEDVHFHELGSLDALVDVVGSCAALSLLAPDKVVASAVATGLGTTVSSHGTIPLPAPAVAEIFRERRAPLFSRGRTELVTPTGAALLATFADDFGDMPPMSLRSVGYGAGSRDDQIPNVLRAFVGEALVPRRTIEELVIECNLDDMAPEMFPNLMTRLLDAGARDAWVTPVTMKKGRPGHVLSVLVAPEDRERATEIIFEEATTLGVRATTVQKEALERRWIEVDVDGCAVRVKVGMNGGRVVTLAPEHDDALTAARATGRPLKSVYALATRAAEEALATPGMP